MVTIGKGDNKSTCNQCNTRIKSSAIMITVPRAFRNIHNHHFTDIQQCYTKEKKRVHIECWQYYWMRPFQCMFADSLRALKQKDQEIVSNYIRSWQKEYCKKVKNYKKYEEAQKKREEKKKKQSGKKRRRSKQQEEDLEEEREEKKVKLETSDEQVFFMGLSPDLWANIFTYLPIADIGMNVAVACQDLNAYACMDYIWEVLGNTRLCDNFTQISKKLNLPCKAAYQQTMNIVCRNCGELCENAEAHYFYFVDGTVCRPCQQQFPLSNKSNAKKNYKLTDADLSNIRSNRSSNPFHRSTAMFHFLDCELQAIFQAKQEKVVRSELLSQLKGSQANRKIKKEEEEEDMNEGNQLLVDNWINECKRKKVGDLYEYLTSTQKSFSVRAIVSAFLAENYE